MKSLFFLISLLLLSGCATVSMLPKNANDIDFSKRVEGKTGWSKYEQFHLFKNVEAIDIYGAAKVGLAQNGFSLISADMEKGAVIGEHGITLHDWNVLAGIYFKKKNESDIDVKVVVEGSKDTGFSGDVTGDSWAGKILIGMRRTFRGRS